MSAAPDHELAKELHATVQARKDLGTEYESELIDSFLEKAAQRIDSQVENRVRRELAQQQMADARVATRGAGGHPRAPEREGHTRRFGLAMVSLVLAVPLSAIAGAYSGLPGLLISWAGIVGVNIAHSLSTARSAEHGRPTSEWD